MERLGHIIDEAVLAGDWKPIRLSEHGPGLSHLFFADDLILFAEASVEQMHVIRLCLDKFCATSRAKINMHKSMICVSNSMPEMLAEQISQAGEIAVTDDLGKYLGIPMSKKRLSKASFSYILDRVDIKLVGWKAKLLSMTGRVTLAQSAVATIPYYTMQTTHLPLSICDEIEKKKLGILFGVPSMKRDAFIYSNGKICDVLNLWAD